MTKNIRVKEMLEAQALLKKVGFTLFSYDPGVVGSPDGTTLSRDYTLSFNYGEWKWLKPLIEELVEYREGKK